MANASAMASASSRTPTSTPASGRPMRSAAVSARVLIELAVTRSRCSTTAGMTAVLAGRNSSVTVAMRKAMTYTSRMSISTANGTATRSPARSRSQAIIVQRRFQRSTSAPANGPRTTFGMAVAAKVRPTSSADPVASRTRNPSATVWIRSPKRLTSWPTHSREKLRFRTSRMYGDSRRRPAISAPASLSSAGTRLLSE